MLPSFVIIGAQKSASSFLHVCLSDHPDIFIPNGETPIFEDPDYHEDIESEFGQIFKNRSETCLGIKRPNYIGRPEVPLRIRKHLPHSKLIAILRNPVDRAISAYYHNINYGFLPLINFNEGIKKILDDPDFRNKYKRSEEIIEFGYYYKYLNLYSDYILNKQLLVFLHEDIIEEPLECIQKTYRFLDVSPNYIPRTLNERPMGVNYNLNRLKFLNLKNRLLYTYNSDMTRLEKKPQNSISKGITKMISTFDLMVLSKITSASRPKIHTEILQKLNMVYEQDTELLETLINRDLSIWKAKS